MHSGQWLTLGTVWLALSLYVAGECVQALRPGDGNAAVARWLNRLGGAAFLAHVAGAFHFYHGWSHAAAYAETARQTASLLGWNRGGGLYINYAFALVWLGEMVWSWNDAPGRAGRPRWMTWAVRGFFLFMIFNGAVVFISGPKRWAGAILCLLLLWCWWPRRKPGAGLPGSHRPD